MSKVVVSQFMSLDGVVEDPAGNEGSGLGPWTFKFDRGDDGNQFKLDELRASDALLLGRKTYEGFAAAWPSRDGEFAEKFNSMAKYVVSTTMDDAEWNNSTVVSGELADEVPKLKEGADGDVLVNGSIKLVRALMENDLVDEYRLMVFPVVLGEGRRLFGEGSPKTTLRLTDTLPVGPEGVVVLTYGRA
jgi:dihydrofolate reductase